MEIFIAALFFLFIGVIVIAIRGKIAERRLQKCIDNGKVLYNGKSIELSESLSEYEKQRLEIERLLYLKSSRLMTGVFKLYNKNSQY
ncbi:hypothetical protein [uncultured Microbulbifer sp.]|uniref:hypothetical protein n=1 Tax=uncultured Microbulbifer sp. TaxID=348147 RepID=UPI0026155953|nr:hypothetical protein [uncultured Microbulbifer sp.]